MTKNVPGHDIGADAGMRLHQTLARGGSLPSGNFGVAPLASHSRGGSYAGQGSMRMTDSQRKAPPPVAVGRGQRAQAQPDHGPST